MMDIETRGIILSKQRTTKARVRWLICDFVVRICINRFYRDVAQIIAEVM